MTRRSPVDFGDNATLVEAALAASWARLYRRYFIRHFIALLVAGCLFALLWQTCLQSDMVSGGSMLPTLKSGDHVLVNRLAYRFGAPARGDVVVFHSPYDLSTNLVKRIIGIPGDWVQVYPRAVAVNGRIVHEPYIAAEGGYRYGPQRVPHGHYFVLGDNRVLSEDSHVFGDVPAQNLIGRVEFIYWPPGDFGGS